VETKFAVVSDAFFSAHCVGKTDSAGIPPTLVLVSL
jgi:hypothetical protein